MLWRFRTFICWVRESLVLQSLQHSFESPITFFTVRCVIIISSEMFNVVPSRPVSTWRISFCNIFGATLTPKFSRLYMYNPICDENTVMLLNSSDNSSRWKPLLESTLENTFGPFYSRSMTSVVGTTWRSRFKSRFAFVISTQSLIWSGALGLHATSMFKTQWFGPFTFSMPCFCSR